jgi:hypothetical protein
MGDRYVGGMGQLSDGQKGQDNFRSDIYGNGKGKERINISKVIKLYCHAKRMLKYAIISPLHVFRIKCGCGLKNI